MKRSAQLFMLIIIILISINPTYILAQTSDQHQGLKKRVAVFNFEDKTDHMWHWWTGQPVGEGMADMLITELVKSGKYRVIERQQIDAIMQEQQLGQTGAVTAQTAAKVGQLLGVELAIFGAVTEFGYKKSEGGLDLKKDRFGIGIQSASASVGIDVRFTNTSTGEILAAESVRKSESKKGLSLDTRAISFKNKNEFDESLVGKATRKAIQEIMTKLDGYMQNLPWQAKIIKVSENVIYINSGAEAGVNIGDVFAVFSKGEELIDPDTGLSLGSEETMIGEIVVTANNIGEGRASKCEVKSGAGFKAGDLVRQK